MGSSHDDADVCHSADRLLYAVYLLLPRSSVSTSDILVLKIILVIGLVIVTKISLVSTHLLVCLLACSITQTSHTDTNCSRATFKGHEYSP